LGDFGLVIETQPSTQHSRSEEHRLYAVDHALGWDGAALYATHQGWHRAAQEIGDLGGGQKFRLGRWHGPPPYSTTQLNASQRKHTVMHRHARSPDDRQAIV
jgi:hypothetical protein